VSGDPVRDALVAHVAALGACRRCATVVGTPVPPPPVVSKIVLCGQAPGPREAGIGRPFAWTAGRTLFRWFATLGVDEATFRERVFITAIARCFPGKASSGGDRLPSATEIAACTPWRQAELDLLQPALVIPVGRLAIATLLGDRPLLEVIGGTFVVDGRDVIPLPHPSGVSTWPKTEPGRTLTASALAAIGAHPVWRATFPPEPGA
jgi:uracil-DNA glycosylase